MHRLRGITRISLILVALASCSKQERKDAAPNPSVAVATSTLSVSSAAASASAASPPAETAAPEGGLETVSGPVLLAKIRASGAKAMIVNAWASWCGPCRREIPMLEGMAQNLKAQGVEFLLVSVDEPEQKPQAEAFLRDHQVSLTSYLASRPLSAFKQALNPRWPGMLPATFLFDGSGKLRYFWGGPAYEEEILPIIEGFLAGKPIDGEATFGLAPGKVE